MSEYPGTPADPNQPATNDGPGSEPAPADPGPAAPTPPESSHSTEPVGEPTMPITGSAEEVGYWERLAREQGQAPQSPYGQPDPTQAYPTQPTYGQQPVYGQVPAYGQQPYGQQPYGQPVYGTGYPQVAPMHGSATTALVLGIISLAGGLVLCGVPFFAAPFAWFIGRKALKEIEASQGRLRGQGEAKAGMVMGIIGTVLLILGILVFAIAIIGIAVESSSSGGSSV